MEIIRVFDFKISEGGGGGGYISTNVTKSKGGIVLKFSSEGVSQVIPQ